MKTLFFLLSASILPLALASCGQSDSSNPAASINATSYPLDVCVVSGEKLGSMGNPHVITHDGVEVRFCCKNCLPEFEKDPAKFVAKLSQ